MKFVISNEQWLYLINKYVSKYINFTVSNFHSINPATILCVKLDEIGDMATCLASFENLKLKYPSSKITVLCKPYCVSLLENNPNVDEIWTEARSWDKKFDVVIEFRGNWKTLFKSIIYRPIVRLDRGTVRIKNRGNQLHETSTNCKIIEPLIGKCSVKKGKVYPTDLQINEVDDFLKNQQIIKPFYVIHASARSELRKWKPAKFAELCDLLINDFSIEIIFIGTENEKQQIAEIQSLMKLKSHAFINSGSLINLCVLIQKSECFIGNESGPLQLADMLDKPCIGLFGPGVKNVFYPQGKNSAVIHHVLECNPCDQIHCVHPENTCMDRITLLEVLQAHKKVIELLGY